MHQKSGLGFIQTPRSGNSKQLDGGLLLHSHWCIVSHRGRGYCQERASIRAIVALYNSGLSLARIENRTNIRKEQTRMILHRAGVQMRHVHAVYHKPKLALDYRVALLLGLHAGDGYLSDSWGIAINRNDVQMGERVLILARDILGVEAYFDRYDDNYYVVRSGKRQVREFFQRFGFRPGRKAATVEVPACVMNSKNIEVSTGFLKGAFSSDGSFWFRDRWGQCRFEVSSVKFRDGFIELAERLGFHFRAYSCIHNGGHNKLGLHTAYIGNRKDVLRWMETIGSIGDTHLRGYEA